MSKNELEKRISFYVPLDIYKAVKVQAAQNNMSIKMFMLNILIEELAKIGAIKLR